MELTSLQNPRVKAAVKLRNRSTRDQTGLFLIEGYRELLRASEANLPIEELFICPEFYLGSNEETLIQSLHVEGKNIHHCSKEVFQKLSYRDRPDGLLAIAPKMKRTLDQIPLSPSPFLVIAEAVEKPGNLGTILRTCDAAGVDGLIVSDPCTDIHNPNVVRASIGTLFRVPVVESTGDEVLQWLNQKQIAIAAATPSATMVHTEADLRQPIAIAMGTEQLGLSSKWMEGADVQIRIPMLGGADSLNVAQATTVLLFEARRQRGWNG